MAQKWKLVARTGAIAGAVAVIATGFPLDASADQDAVDRAQERVEELQMEAAALDQEAIGAQEELDAAQQRLTTQREDVDAQTEKVDGMKKQVGQVAVAQYQDRHIDPSTRLLLHSDDDKFLNRYATVQQLNSNQKDVLLSYQTESANLNDMRRSAAADVTTIEDQKKKVESARAESASKLQEAEDELDRLTEEERQRLEEIERQKAEEAQRAAEEAAAEEEAAQQEESNSGESGSEESDSGESSDDSDSGDSDSGESGSGDSESGDGSNGGSDNSDDGDSVVVPPGSSKGSAALAFAKAQIGKPYSYGGTGPGAYDCSGLTGAAWASAGVSIPRTSGAQYGAGTPVSKGDLKPGDLVFYYSGISHVGIYAGGGQIVHASRPGKPVGYAPLDSMPYQGARRVG